MFTAISDYVRRAENLIVFHQLSIAIDETKKAQNGRSLKAVKKLLLNFGNSKYLITNEKNVYLRSLDLVY
jgi:hypothetical protein